MKKKPDIIKKLEADIRRAKLRIKVKRLKDFTSNYSCRGCLTLTNKMYRVRGINVIACCADCARDVSECIKDKRPWAVPPKILKQMSKEQQDAIIRFWFPIERAKYPQYISKELISIKIK